MWHKKDEKPNNIIQKTLEALKCNKKYLNLTKRYILMQFQYDIESIKKMLEKSYPRAREQ